MHRTMYADPKGQFLHNVILESCARFPHRTALVDTSTGERITYGEFASRVERLANGLVNAGLRPGEIVGIFLPNCWEFCVLYQAITLAGGVPTMLNPSYRERELRHQLRDSGASLLVTDGALIGNINLGGLSALRRVYTTRTHVPGSEAFANLLRTTVACLPQVSASSEETLASLPYSSGTTGLPKGVMLSHYNLVANVYQLLVSPIAPTIGPDHVVLCVLPLFHIYGLNVVLHSTLTVGGTVVLMPRFDPAKTFELMKTEGITMIPCVPPMLNAFCQAAEHGAFPSEHRVAWVKSGAAPLAPELARRFNTLTGIPIRQGYGMTEASPVTHMGYIEPQWYRPDSIGTPVAATDCVVIDEHGGEVGPNEPGELVMRGPQFMLGYWKAPDATSAVLRDGWYWSGDVVRRDEAGFYYVIDRRKEMIKYKGFSIAPAEIESVLLEHPAVRDCGVVGRPDTESGEAPCAFVVLRERYVASGKMASELKAWVGEQLSNYKQPRDVEFVSVIPHTPSGKILRRELREMAT